MRPLANRSFVTQGGGPGARNIHLLTPEERELTRVKWPQPGGVVPELGLWRIWTPFDEPLPPPSEKHNTDRQRPAAACAWQRVQLSRELDADLCLHTER